MTPAQHTRIVLAEFKAIGTPFKTAWAYTMRTIPRGDNDGGKDYEEWKRTLKWARPAFEAWYEGGSFEAMTIDAEHTRLVRCERELLAA